MIIIFGDLFQISWTEIFVCQSQVSSLWVDICFQLHTRNVPCTGDYVLRDSRKSENANREAFWLSLSDQNVQFANLCSCAHAPGKTHMMANYQQNSRRERNITSNFQNNTQKVKTRCTNRSAPNLSYHMRIFCGLCKQRGDLSSSIWPKLFLSQLYQLPTCSMYSLRMIVLIRPTPQWNKTRRNCSNCS